MAFGNEKYPNPHHGKGFSACSERPLTENDLFIAEVVKLRKEIPRGIMGLRLNTEFRNCPYVQNVQEKKVYHGAWSGVDDLTVADCKLNDQCSCLHTCEVGQELDEFLAITNNLAGTTYSRESADIAKILRPEVEKYVTRRNRPQKN